MIDRSAAQSCFYLMLRKMEEKSFLMPRRIRFSVSLRRTVSFPASRFISDVEDISENPARCSIHKPLFCDGAGHASARNNLVSGLCTTYRWRSRHLLLSSRLRISLRNPFSESLHFCMFTGHPYDSHVASLHISSASPSSFT